MEDTSINGLINEYGITYLTVNYKMAYKMRRVGRRRVGPVRRLAKPKSTAITTLAKAVRGLQRKNRVEAEYLNFSQNIDNVNIPTSIVQNLTYYTGMTNIFGVSADDLEANKIVHKSIGMDIRISLENSINNEEETVNFTSYLVSCKDSIGGYFLPGSGSLTLTEGITHSTQRGMVLLNKKMFNIHKTKRFTLTNYGTALTAPAAQSQYGTDKRWYWRISPNKLVQNPAGNWKALNSALDPSKCYFLIVFSDNSQVDLESPSFNASIVHTMKTVA